MKNISIIFSFILILGFVSCGDDYFEVNVPSNAVEEDDLRMSDLLGPVIHSTILGQYSVEQSFGNYAQYFVSDGGGAAGLTSASGLWSEVYLFVLPNINSIKAKAAASNAIYYDGVADVLTAINIGIATDTWDNIPYTSASGGVENLSPTFDEQQAIYDEILSLLDSAIASFGQADASGLTPGNEDLIYRGDIDKWERAAYTLKARYLLRLMTKGVASPSEVLSAVNNGFTSNSDDFQMDFDERNLNPWYTVEVVAKSTGNFHHDIAEQLVSSMNGDYFPFDGSLDIDPRLPVFADNGGDAEWKGYVSGGEGLASDGTEANADFAGNSFYTSPNSPLVLITFAEAMFIKAEAEFWAAGGSTTSTGSSSAAYDAYINGIMASMEKFGVDGSDYLDDDAISMGSDDLRLEHIMKEKYIHNFLNPESFSDFRRYDFSDNVFRGLELRANSEDEDPEFAGQWFRRADYPSSERNRNPSVVSANEESVVVPVWWDE